MIKGPQRKVNVQHVRSPLCVCWTKNGHDGINVKFYDAHRFVYSGCFDLENL